MIGWWRLSPKATSELYRTKFSSFNGREAWVAISQNKCYFAIHRIESCVSEEEDCDEAFGKAQREWFDVVNKEMEFETQLTELMKHPLRNLFSIMSLKGEYSYVRNVEAEAKKIHYFKLKEEHDQTYHESYMERNRVIQEYDSLVLEWDLASGQTTRYAEVDLESGEEIFLRNIEIDHQVGGTLLWLEAFIQKDEKTFNDVINDAQRNHRERGKIKCFFDLPTDGTKVTQGNLKELSRLSYDI